MKRRPLRFMLPLVALATLALAPRAGHGAQPDTVEQEVVAQQDPLEIAVELASETLTKAHRDKIDSALDEGLAALVDTHGMLRVPLGTVPRDELDLYVRLEVSQPDPSVDVFLVHAVALHRGEVLRREDVRTCVQCTASELVEDGLKIIPVVLEDIEARRAEAAVQEEPPAPKPPSSETRDVAPPRAPGPVGITGISASALGLGSAIAGAVLLGRGRVEEPVPGAMIEFVDYRPPGRALLGVGLGLMVVGEILLAVDLSVLSRKRRARRHAELSYLSPALVDGPGIAVGGRF